MIKAGKKIGHSVPWRHSCGARRSVGIREIEKGGEDDKRGERSLVVGNAHDVHDNYWLEYVLACTLRSAQPMIGHHEPAPTFRIFCLHHQKKKKKHFINEPRDRGYRTFLIVRRSASHQLVVVHVFHSSAVYHSFCSLSFTSAPGSPGVNDRFGVFRPHVSPGKEEQRRNNKRLAAVAFVVFSYWYKSLYKNT